MSVLLKMAGASFAASFVSALSASLINAGFLSVWFGLISLLAIIFGVGCILVWAEEDN